jgi:hypothetical protein
MAIIIVEQPRRTVKGRFIFHFDGDLSDSFQIFQITTVGALPTCRLCSLANRGHDRSLHKYEELAYTRDGSYWPS